MATRAAVARGELEGCLAAQQWLTALAQWCEGADGARVKQQLSELLRCGSRHRDKLVGVANRARQQIANIFSWAHQKEDPPGADTPARARQCQYLFERVLHSMLHTALAEEEAARRKPGADGPGPTGGGAGSGGQPGAAGGSPGGSDGGLSTAERSRVVESVLDDEEYQLGLVHACIEVVNFAYLRSPAEAFPWAALQLRRMHHSVELWQGIDWLVDGLSGPPAGSEGTVPGIPEEVVAYLSAIQVRVEEELAFIDGSSMYKRIVATGATSTGSNGADAGSDDEAMDTDVSDGDSPERRRRRQRARRGSHSQRGTGPDAALVARFLTNLARTAMLRTAYVAQELLREHPSLEAACPELGRRACALLDALLGDHLDMLFGQHVSVAIACALFFTIRHHGGSLSFRKLTGLMAALLPNHDDATFGRVELPAEEEGGWDGSSRDYGDTRAYYNRVFLPVFVDKDAAYLFGDDSMAATPSKAQLEAPAAETTGPDSGHLVPPAAIASGRLRGARGGKVQAAGAAAVLDGAKEQRRQRRPLGQVVNGTTTGGGGSKAGPAGRAGGAAQAR
ncbi:hypothetical protein ABPG75_009104 [Micractinium tetrahymenae]